MFSGLEMSRKREAPDRFLSTARRLKNPVETVVAECGQKSDGHGPAEHETHAEKRSKNSGNVLLTHPGLRIVSPGMRIPATAKLIAIRWSS